MADYTLEAIRCQTYPLRFGLGNGGLQHGPGTLLRPDMDSSLSFMPLCARQVIDGCVLPPWLRIRRGFGLYSVAWL